MMGCDKLSHQLLDLGFLPVLGVSESPNQYIKKGTPFTWDRNNGVVVIYDETGMPWIAAANKNREKVYGLGSIPTHVNTLKEIARRHSLSRGAYVPHSNDGGRFVRKLLFTL